MPQRIISEEDKIKMKIKKIKNAEVLTCLALYRKKRTLFSNVHMPCWRPWTWTICPPVQCDFCCGTGLVLVKFSIIIGPHRSTTYVDSAYCNQPRSVVCLSVCLSVCHISETCKNGSTNRDTVWVVHSGWPRESCIRWGPDSPWEGAILREKGESYCKV